MRPAPVWPAAPPSLLAGSAVDGLHRAPVLAAGALPVVRARAEAAASAAVGGCAGHQLLGELLQHQQDVAFLGPALRQAELDQRALPPHRGPPPELAGEELDRRLGAVLLLDHP